MCGIFAVINRSRLLNDPDILRHLELVSRRGPDSSNAVTINLENGFYLHMVSYVLHLRGDKVVEQPYQHINGDALQWNGEIFGGIQVKDHDCDTIALTGALSTCEDDTSVCNVLRNIQGPWAFVFYQKSLNKLWFGLDYFGRRSLLYRRSKDEFIMSSVARKHDSAHKAWSQVQADGIYMINVADLDKDFTVCCYLWKSITQRECSKFETLKSYNTNYENTLLDDTIDMKSGPQHEENHSKPIIKDLSSNFSEIFDKKLSNLDVLAHIYGCKDFSNVVDQFLATLREAVRKRVVNVPKKTGCESSVGVLFSGGIDCTVLALLVDEFVPREEPIVLLNVAFETPTTNGKFEVPDRVTGRSSVNELEILRPDRRWRFIEIDVTLEELQRNRKDHISDLTYPLTTVLDDSIGCALWFASRGKQGLTDQPLCDTKVLLSGLGADEQLGGYSRHRTTHRRDGLTGLEKELSLEIERLSERNLGRDDRIISDHAKEARFPYLDENVVSFFTRTPLPYKVNFMFPRGVGEKILLRTAGYVLGLRNSAILPKRAIQFGSRIAKAESRKEKASDICERLL